MICPEMMVDLWWILIDYVQLEVFRAELSCRQVEMKEK